MKSITDQDEATYWQMQRRLISCLPFVTHAVAATVCAVFEGCLSTAAFAQTTASSDGTGTQLQEIIVTAQKRAENLQDVPVSITAISARELEDAGIVSFTDYAVKVPNLTFSYANDQGVVESRSIAIRGIQGTQTTGLYLNDVPLPDGVDPLAVDLQRIEVLRGPQGTLYGARSMGGTVRLITEVPNPGEFSAFVHGGLSTLQRGDSGYQFDGGLNVGLGSAAAIRLDVVTRSSPGWLTRRFPESSSPNGYGEVNGVAKRDDAGASLALQWNPTSSVSFRPYVIYQYSEMNGMPLGDKVPSNNIQSRLFNIQEGTWDEWTDVGLVVNWKTAIGEISSSSAYFYRNDWDREDGSEWLAYAFAFSPALPSPLVSTYPYHEFVEEARLASNQFGPFRFTGGIYYASIANNYRNPSWVVNGLGMVNSGEFGADLVYKTVDNFQVHDRAIFGELTYQLAKHWSSIFGLRYSTNAQSFTRAADGILNGGPTYDTGSASQSKVTPKVTLAFRPNAALNIYATAAEGFRPGGPNYPLPPLCAGDLANLGLTFEDTKTFKSDSVWSYEFGEKARLFDGRVSIDSAAFWINWTEIQQTRFLPTCAFTFVGNAGAARSRGAEMELSARPTRGLSLSLGVGYTDARITESGPTLAAQVGDPIQQVAPWTITAAVEYLLPLYTSIDGGVRFDYSFEDNSRSATNDQFNPRLRPSYEILNARVGVTSHSSRTWEGWFYVNNITNARPNLTDDISTVAELPGRPRILTSPPRTFGMEFRRRL